MDQSFTVDPRIKGDSMAVGDLPLCHVRLMDEARYPWLLLLPRRLGLSEWTELEAPDLARVSAEIKQASDALRLVMPFQKLNVGALGNIVSQLHIHLIGRHAGDPAWPGPVWGHSARLARGAEATAALIAQLQRALGVASLPLGGDHY